MSSFPPNPDTADGSEELTASAVGANGVNTLQTAPPAVEQGAARSALFNENNDKSPGCLPKKKRNIFVRMWSGICSACQWCFGVFCLIGGLAFLANIPIIQLLSLGYLLEASGRVSRSGRIRDGFVGVRKAARIGSLVLGTWLMILPLRYVWGVWYASSLIDHQSSTANFWRMIYYVLGGLTSALLLWAWIRGGRLRHFIWPAPWRLVKELRSGGMLTRASDAAWNFVVGLRLPYYFWLGARGFTGALAWLIIPIMLMLGGSYLPGAFAGVSLFLGSVLLAIVLLYLPFLQAHFAAENRMRAMFEFGEVRSMFRRAPIAYWFALFITLLFALPLFLLKIELTPQQLAWLPSLFFVLFIFPARIATGWAIGRARRREEMRHFLFRWMARIAAVPVVAFFVLIVFASRLTSWEGAWSLFEQHSFLVPTPFLSLPFLSF